MSTWAQPGRLRRPGRGPKAIETSAKGQFSKTPHTQKSGHPPGFGPFLAYQFTTDLNYSKYLTFEESEFVVPGPGARDGIRKCFDSIGDYDEADVIRWVTERQQTEFRSRGLKFESPWGRDLQLIDCQNLFCEVDKYARVAHPNVRGEGFDR